MPPLFELVENRLGVGKERTGPFDRLEEPLGKPIVILGHLLDEPSVFNPHLRMTHYA